ncbi:MAG: hypothetical protein QMD92_04575 [bacterium]|nr:hypothetical protein [bacterium]
MINRRYISKVLSKMDIYRKDEIEEIKSRINVLEKKQKMQKNK